MSEYQQEQQRLVQKVQDDIRTIDATKCNQRGVLAQTVFLGTLGLVLVMPIIAGAYLGVWLDNKLTGFSISWTVSLLFIGVIVGAVNVYCLLKK